MLERPATILPKNETWWVYYYFYKGSAATIYISLAIVFFSSTRAVKTKPDLFSSSILSSTVDEKEEFAMLSVFSTMGTYKCCLRDTDVYYLMVLYIIQFAIFCHEAEYILLLCKKGFQIFCGTGNSVPFSTRHFVVDSP